MRHKWTVNWWTINILGVNTWAREEKKQFTADHKWLSGAPSASTAGYVHLHFKKEGSKSRYYANAMQRPEARRQRLIWKLTCCHRDGSPLHWDKQCGAKKKKKERINSAFSGLQSWLKWLFSQLSDWIKIATGWKRKKRRRLFKLHASSTSARVDGRRDSASSWRAAPGYSNCFFFYFLWGHSGSCVSLCTVEESQKRRLKCIFILPAAYHSCAFFFPHRSYAVSCSKVKMMELQSTETELGIKYR